MSINAFDSVREAVSRAEDDARRAGKEWEAFAEVNANRTILKREELRPV